MTKIINFSVILLIGIISSQAHAKTLELKSNESKLLTNSAIWTLNATCTIQGTHKTSSKIKIGVLKKNGTINGKSLSTGQFTFVTVNDNSRISVSAEAGTQINLRNLGHEELQATCSFL
jgi:hypothetical protein